MDFKDELLILAERVGKLKDNVKTEEATKTSFVLPFLQALGYDIFNPEEVTPECICDYGTKKGEKIDYTVCMDGEPIMLIECKHWSADLSKYKAQLFRYYHVSQAKFGVLTNGINYLQLCKSYIIYETNDVRRKTQRFDITQKGIRIDGRDMSPHAAEVWV